MYSEEKAKLVRAEAERVELADEEMASALEYMGLPASLSRFRSGASAQSSLADPGPQVRSWVDEVRTGEIESRVEDMFRQIGRSRDSARNSLDRLSSDLDTESRECESLRNKFGHLWEQAPSSSATRSFRQDIKSHRESLDQAASSDHQAQNLWNGIRGDIGMMTEPSGNALEQAFNEAIAGKGGNEINLLDADFATEEGDDEETRKKVETVSEALVRLNKIKKERSDVLKDFKEKVSFGCLLIQERLADDLMPHRFKPTTFLTSSSSIAKAHQLSNPRYSQLNSKSSALTSNASLRLSPLSSPSSPRSTLASRLSQKVRKLEKRQENGLQLNEAKKS